MALYLTYRPKDFLSLVGQAFIKETLQKAVEQDKTVGAYLFTGPRGTGKTSTARIFAKAINCLSPQAGNPCGVCTICTNFQENRLIDIIEIDAASYTGVDNIREIIEKAQFQPTQTKYKIYIIDEVHMLSKGAFNALLKILEEPPVHVKFILATTEIQKVPETILSRCQRYDFKSINDRDLRERLKYIAEKEVISVDEKSYDYIVQHAEGGLRNAISLFEQLIQDGSISFDYISATLGVGTQQEKQVFLEKIISRDISLLQDFETLTLQGKNMKIFFKEILSELLHQTQKQLHAGKNITQLLSSLESLQEVLMKSKNSFDETLTLKIGLLKILSGTQSQSEKPLLFSAVKTPISLQDPSQTLEKKETQTETQDIPIEKQEASFEAISDIFSQPEIPKASATTGFDVERFITQVRTQGAKAAVTMSLRGSELKHIGDTLHIQTKTTIAYNGLVLAENQNFILQAGEVLGLGIQKIKIL